MFESRPYRVICFDLDGTLLPMDIDEFMIAYFKRIGTYAATHGLDPERFTTALKTGTKAMATHDGTHTNAQAFWETFGEVYGPTNADVRAIANEFYDTDFAHIGDGFKGNPAAARVVHILRAKGYPLVLTTMPMFPRRAVEQRLHWAGVNPAVFQRITNYENSRAVKPRQTYFAENLAAMGVAGKDVLMVGNNTLEDLAFLDLGVDAYLVTDWLLNPVNFDISTVRHGSLTDLEAWADKLPPCENPATHITQDAIALEQTMLALENNAVVPIDMEQAAADAAAVADSVAGNHSHHAATNLKIEH